MEQWNDGILGPFVFHLVEKYYGSWNKQTMDPKNLDPDTEVMRFLPLFHCSIIPCKRHKTIDVKRCMISIYYRNSETCQGGGMHLISLYCPYPR
jgi:hypothetical protein